MDDPNLHVDQDAAEEMAANSVLKYLHECDVVGEQNKRQWIERVFNRVKEKELTH
jgi:hypothetical protein